MKPVRNRAGVILNTAVLRDTQIVGEPVLCPGCGEKTFDRWPDGWEEHAARRCAALESTDAAERRAEYRSRFRNLFEG